MKLQDLQSKGAFVGAEPVQKTVSWTNDAGEELSFEVGVRRMSMGDWERVMVHEDDERSASARIIATVIVLEDGVRMTYAQAYQLTPSLANALLNVHNQVNRRPEKKA